MEVPKCVAVPKTAYRYWPKGDEAVQAPGKFGTRLIFARQEFAESEDDIVEQLQALLDTRVRLTESLQRHDLLRYIYAAKWDVSKAATMLQRHLSWVETDLPKLYPSEQPDAILLAGGLYLHGRDHRYRPMLFIVPEKLKSFPVAKVMQAGVFLMEYVLDHMMLPGQIESLGLLADCSDSEGVCYSVDELKTLLGFFMLHYPCRLAWGCISNGKYCMWSRLTAFLDPETSGKFLLNPTSTELLSLCHSSQLESKYGGQANNLTAFWPPSFPELSHSREKLAKPVSDYSSYQEYHPESSMTETSGVGTGLSRELVQGILGDHAHITLESEISDQSEAHALEDRNLNEVTESLCGRINMTEVKNRAYSPRHNMVMEKTGVQRGCCACISIQESRCQLW